MRSKYQTLGGGEKVTCDMLWLLAFDQVVSGVCRE